MIDPYCPFHGSEPTAYDNCSCPPFSWPCGRRDAHHEHTVRCANCGGSGRPGIDVNVGYCSWCDGNGFIECRGVEAHPSTMAGGSWRRW